MTSSTPTPPPASPSSGGGEIIYPQQPPKDPVLILVLNLLLLGGVGYIIIGQKTKGIVAIVVWVIGFVPPSCGILSALLMIVAAIDGWMQAQQLQQGHPVGQWTFFQDHK